MTGTQVSQKQDGLEISQEGLNIQIQDHKTADERNTYNGLFETKFIFA